MQSESVVDVRNDSTNKKTVTVLVPCFNEQESLPMLFDRMDALITQSKDLDYTLMFVDDGSRDNTKSLIKEYANQHDYVEYIFLSRNFGKEKAMYAGIENVHTDAMVIIDADLQDPPELIPQMAELWRQGYDDVYARRRSREGESWLKKATSRWYYDLLQKVSGVAIQKDTGDFRLLDRKCIDDRDKRIAGKTKWNYLKLFHLAMDGITSFTTAPLKIATWIGSLVSVAAVIYAVVILVRTLAWGVDVPGYASTMVVVLILGGVQLLSLGIIGEYLGRIFMQTKDRPVYLVQEQKIN